MHVASKFLEDKNLGSKVILKSKGEKIIGLLMAAFRFVQYNP